MCNRITCELKFFSKFVLSPSLEERGNIFNISRALSYFLLFSHSIIRVSSAIFPLIQKFLCPESNREFFVTITAVKREIYRKNQCKKFISHFLTNYIRTGIEIWRRPLASEKYPEKAYKNNCKQSEQGRRERDRKNV